MNFCCGGILTRRKILTFLTKTTADLTLNFTEVSSFRRSVMAFHTFPRSTVLALKIQGSEALTSFARIKSSSSVHSMIELKGGKQNLIKNRPCLWIHLSVIFQSFRDKSEEQNSILYKQVLAI